MLILRCKSRVQSMYSYLHNFQLLHLYSTKSPNQSYSDYLVNNLGFTQPEAHSTSTKIKTKIDNYSKFCNNANSVVDFLQQHGFDDTHLKKAVSCYPQILSYSVDKTLIPKFKVFQDHGFSGSDLVSIISASPTFLSINLDPIIEDLRAVLGGNENLIKHFRKSFWCSTSSLENLVSNVTLLNNEYGVDIDIIRNNIHGWPECFLRKPEVFRNVLVRVEEELGIPRISPMFVYGIILLTCLSKENIESKCQALRSLGWTEYHVSELMRRNPNAFHKSVENIKKILGFLMTELGYHPDFLVRALFTCSLEKRLVPRRRVLLILKEKGLLDYNFYSAIRKTETEFLKILVEPYKEAVPGLLEVYQNSKGSSEVRGRDAKL